jgi:hypothetical protein
MPYKKYILRLSVLIVTVVFSVTSYADHAWGDYKWRAKELPLNLDLGDNVNSDWDGYLLNTSTDWSVSTVIATTIIAGVTDPLECNPQSGNVQVCNAAYGSTGWLGIAQIYVRGFTIFAATTQLNDTYFNTSTYDTPAWRQMVMCQEIGHTFGLDHQDVNFSNVNLGSCMDYTNDPDGTIDGELSNEHPNQHDYGQLVTIYDSGKGGKKTVNSIAARAMCNPESSGCNQAFAASSSVSWGRLVFEDGGERIYIKELGNGEKVITFVTLTLERTAAANN